MAGPADGWPWPSVPSGGPGGVPWVTVPAAAQPWDGSNTSDEFGQPSLGWGQPKATAGTGVTRAVPAGESRGCAAHHAAPGGWQLGLFPFPGQLWPLASGPGPLSPLPEAGGAPQVWVSLALRLRQRRSALVRVHGCWRFMKVNES